MSHTQKNTLPPYPVAHAKITQERAMAQPVLCRELKAAASYTDMWCIPSDVYGPYTIRLVILIDITQPATTHRCKTQTDFLITTTDRARAVPLSSPLFNVCLTCIFNELMYDWRYVCVCMCMSVLCLRGGCIFCVTFPALAFSYLLIEIDNSTLARFCKNSNYPSSIYRSSPISVAG